MPRDALPEPKTVSDVLREAAALVRQGWCRHELAMDKDGHGCEAFSDEAVAWCLMGAIDRAADNVLLANVALCRVAEVNSIRLPQAWNDYCATCAEDVARVLERAAR